MKQLNRAKISAFFKTDRGERIKFIICALCFLAVAVNTLKLGYEKDIASSFRDQQRAEWEEARRSPDQCFALEHKPQLTVCQDITFKVPVQNKKRIRRCVPGPSEAKLESHIKIESEPITNSLPTGESSLLAYVPRIRIKRSSDTLNKNK